MKLLYNVILIKINANHNDLFANEVYGKTYHLPEVGKGFRFIAETFTPGLAYRLINTSVIKEIEKKDNNTYIFKTINSTYGLTIVGVEETA